MNKILSIFILFAFFITLLSLGFSSQPGYICNAPTVIGGEKIVQCTITMPSANLTLDSTILPTTDINELMILLQTPADLNLIQTANISQNFIVSVYPNYDDNITATNINLNFKDKLFELDLLGDYIYSIGPINISGQGSLDINKLNIQDISNSNGTKVTIDGVNSLSNVLISNKDSITVGTNFVLNTNSSSFDDFNVFEKNSMSWIKINQIGPVIINKLSLNYVYLDLNSLVLNTNTFINKSILGITDLNLINAELDLNASLIMNLYSFVGSKTNVYAIGDNSKIIIFGNMPLGTTAEFMGFRLYSTGTKEAILTIRDTNYAGAVISVDPLNIGAASWYVKLINLTTPSKILINLAYTKDANSYAFHNLLWISNSSNIITSGPDFNRVDLLNDSSPATHMFLVRDSNNITISNFKYYVNDYTKKNTQKNINTLYFDDCNYCTVKNNVLNNSSISIYTGSSNNNLKIISNSFGYNFSILNYSNVIFYNNFLIDNKYLYMNTNSAPQLTLGVGAYATNSMGHYSFCNLNINKYLDTNLPLNAMPMYYFSQSNKFIVNNYSPVCNGGNLYAEKALPEFCGASCLVDGVDNDSVSETKVDINVMGGIISDVAPLLYLPADCKIYTKDISTKGLSCFINSLNVDINLDQYSDPTIKYVDLNYRTAANVFVIEHQDKNLNYSVSTDLNPNSLGFDETSLYNLLPNLYNNTGGTSSLSAIFEMIFGNITFNLNFDTNDVNLLNISLTDMGFLNVFGNHGKLNVNTTSVSGNGFSIVSLNDFNTIHNGIFDTNLFNLVVINNLIEPKFTNLSMYSKGNFFTNSSAFNVLVLNNPKINTIAHLDLTNGVLILTKNSSTLNTVAGLFGYPILTNSISDLNVLNSSTLNSSIVILNNLYLSDANLDLNNSIIYPYDNDTNIFAFGANANLKIHDLNLSAFKITTNSVFPLGRFNIYSTGKKDSVLEISNIIDINNDLNFIVAPMSDDSTATNYLKLSNLKLTNNKNLYITLIYDSLRAIPEQFFGLLKIFNSDRIIINGPDFGFVEKYTPKVKLELMEL